MRLFDFYIFGKHLYFDISYIKKTRQDTSFTPEQLSGLKWTSLDIDKSKEEAIHLLIKRETIATELIKRIRDKKITGIEALIPEDLPDMRKYNFQWGIFKESTKAKTTYIFLNTLKDILNDSKKTIIFENWAYEKKSLKVQRDPLDIPYFIYNDKVYFSYDKGMSLNYDIKQMYNWSDNYPFLCVSINEEFKYGTGETISDQEMGKIINSMNVAFIGAYDEESFIKITFK